MAASDGAAEAAEPFVTDLPSPPVDTVVLRPINTVGPQPTPEQIIFFYGDKEWEVFVLEWVRGLSTEYDHVRQVGGSGDQGVDVAGFTTNRGFEDDWDCYQCKHYSRSITPSDIWPEIFKVFYHVSLDHYTLPRRYTILAPRGCGPKLSGLLLRPTDMATAFTAELDKSGAFIAEYGEVNVKKVREFADGVDFSIFEAASMDSVLEQHKKTPHHVRRFGASLPDRMAPEPPPEDVELHEARYVAQLVDVYREKYKIAELTTSEALINNMTRNHFRRQRERFYSAESLRVFARDSVPPGTFEDLQEEIYDGVIDKADGDYPDGMARLDDVLDRAVSIEVTSNRLIDVTKMKDRQGICHQLANEDRLTWCRLREEES